MNESLNDCYNTFLTDNGVSAEKSDVTAFTKWLEKNYSEEMDDLFPVYQKNKKITAQDIYDFLWSNFACSVRYIRRKIKG